MQLKILEILACCPFGSNQPELTYFSLPIILYSAFGGGKCFTLSCESLQLEHKTLHSLLLQHYPGPGALSGSLFEPAGIDEN